MRIIFFGTADFAVESLKTLYNDGYEILAVVTAPDKPAGRGMKLRPSPVKKAALDLGLKILQPEKLKAPDFIQTLRELDPQLQVVVAFRFLPKQVWQIPPLGTINLHASYLPNYRGASPINWVLINGEKYTGVTTFFIDEKIDTGKIILRKKIEILPDDDAGKLHDRLMFQGAELLSQTVSLIEQGKAKPIPQEKLMDGIEELKLAPKIHKQDCKINWDWDALKVYNFVRGLSPYPGAWTSFKDNERGKVYDYVKIYKVKPIAQHHNLKTGTILTDDKTFMKIAVNDGFVEILKLQLPGKKVLDITEFFNGYKASALEIV